MKTIIDTAPKNKTAPLAPADAPSLRVAGGLNARQVYIKTYGCQMNVYDSERMAEALGVGGYTETDDPSAADLIILNTCHIREKAAEKVYSELGRLRQVKEERAAQGAGTLIAVAGCVAQAEGEEMVARAPVVDLVIGPQAYHHLPRLLRDVEAGGRSVVYTEFDDADKFEALPKARPARGYAAFLTVQEGCDKFCTFCVVPYTRGMEFSRPVDALIDEAERLVAQGVREITLLGQNVNAYHGVGPDGAEWTLAMLLRRLAQIDGLARLRYTTSHPRDMGDDLIAAHADLANLMPYLHLPFQSGSDRILAAMNRKHTAAHYMELVGRIRAARPDIALSSDVIVGFPGETDADFEETMALVQAVGFAQAFSFKYSPRPGTPAARIAEQVPEDVKSARLARLQDALRTQQSEFNASCVGATLPVLFEKDGRFPGQLVGRSPYLQPVHASGPAHLIGRIVDVEIATQNPNSLGGVIKGASAAHIAAE